MAKSKRARRSSTEWLFRNLPFIFFLGVLGVVYIAAGHYAEKKKRRIEQLQKDLKVLKWEYVTIESEIMSGSTPSKMIERNKQKNLGRDGGEVMKITAED